MDGMFQTLISIVQYFTGLVQKLKLRHTQE